MFDRVKYKQIAKQQLKGRYLTPVLATLVTIIIIAVVFAPGAIAQKNAIKDTEIITASNNILISSSYAKMPKSRTGLISSIILYIISGALMMANIRLYIILSHTTEKLDFAVFIKGFSLWLQGFLGIVWYTIWVSLWSVLFIIPGIVKAFSYAMMFFILAEHPNVGVRKAMRMSKVMTNGYKGDLFVMTLSFIGWEILSLFTAGLLQLWLEPYQTMSFVNAYHALKDKALETGVLTLQDFEQE